MNILGTEDGRYRETLRSLPFYYDPTAFTETLSQPAMMILRFVMIRHQVLSMFESGPCVNGVFEVRGWCILSSSYPYALQLTVQRKYKLLKQISTLLIYCEFFKIMKLTNNKCSLFNSSCWLRWETVSWECVNSWYALYIRYTCLQRKWSDIRRTKSENYPS